MLGPGQRGAVSPATMNKGRTLAQNPFEGITEEKLREETAKCNDRLKKLHFRNYQVDEEITIRIVKIFEEIRERQELVQRYKEDFDLFQKEQEDPNQVRDHVIAQQFDILQREIRLLENSIIGLERAMISPENRQTEASKAVYEYTRDYKLAISILWFISKDFSEKPMKEIEKLKVEIKFNNLKIINDSN